MYRSPYERFDADEDMAYFPHTGQSASDASMNTIDDEGNEMEPHEEQEHGASSEMPSLRTPVAPAGFADRSAAESFQTFRTWRPDSVSRESRLQSFFTSSPSVASWPKHTPQQPDEQRGASFLPSSSSVGWPKQQPREPDDHNAFAPKDDFPVPPPPRAPSRIWRDHVNELGRSPVPSLSSKLSFAAPRKELSQKAQPLQPLAHEENLSAPDVEIDADNRTSGVADEPEPMDDIRDLPASPSKAGIMPPSLSKLMFGSPFRAKEATALQLSQPQRSNRPLTAPAQGNVSKRPLTPSNELTSTKVRRWQTNAQRFENSNRFQAPLDPIAQRENIPPPNNIPELSSSFNAGACSSGIAFQQPTSVAASDLLTEFRNLHNDLSQLEAEADELDLMLSRNHRAAQQLSASSLSLTMRLMTAISPWALNELARVKQANDDTRQLMADLMNMGFK